MTKITVLLQQRQTGQTTPIELDDGTHAIIGGRKAWTARGQRYYEVPMTLEEFNRLAPRLFTAQRPPGHEYIPQVVVEEVAGSDDAALLEKIGYLETHLSAAQKCIAEFSAVVSERDDEIKRLTAELDEATRPSVTPPPQPPCDNAHVAEGCEKFPEPVTPPEYDLTATSPPDAPKVTAPKIDDLVSTEIIAQKLTKQKYRVNEMAVELGISATAFRAYLDLADSPFQNAAGWVKHREPVSA